MSQSVTVEHSVTSARVAFFDRTASSEAKLDILDA
jgi:hypothetical protein